jgi:GntR family transcriptional regulator
MDIRLWQDRLDRYSPVPLYQQLSDILVKKIDNGELKAGDRLPSESELVDFFKVSRHVVRQTLANLAYQGVIYTEQGRGSFVSPEKIEKPLAILQSYHQSMQSRGWAVEVRITKKEICQPPANIAARLALPPQEKAVYLERVAYLDGKPTNLLLSYLAPTPCGLDSLMRFSRGSLYTYLAQACGVHLTRAQNYIELIFASPFESSLLNIARGTALLQILGVVFDSEGRAIEYSRVVYPAMSFRFYFESYMIGSEEPRVVQDPSEA